MNTTPDSPGPARVIRWLPAIAWAGVIFAASSLPGTSIPGGYSAWGHLGEYLVLGSLVAWGLGRRDLASVVLVVAVCAFWGLSDELHQAFVPFRTPDPLDWVTDVAGALTGAWGYLVWAETRARRLARQ